MRILVIGGNGFIGTPMVRELIDDGNDLAILHRNPGGFSQSASARYIRGNRNRLEDYITELRSFGPDLIVDMILSSREQAQQLMVVARNLNARVLAISSMDVYRAWGVMLGTEPGGLEPMPITEDSSLRAGPGSYPPVLVETMKTIFTWVTEGYDKAAVEREVMSAGARNTVVRLPMVYGPGDPLHRMFGVVKRIRDRRPAIILSDQHAAWRGPRGYVENVAHAIVLAAGSDRAQGRIYHVCDEPTLSELEWEAKIAEQASWQGHFVVLPSQQTPKNLLPFGNMSQHLVASSERIRNELGYKETVRREEAIRRTIAWEENNPPTGATFHQFDYFAEDAALKP